MNAETVSEEILGRFPGITDDYEFSSASGCLIRSEYEGGLEISSQVTFNIHVEANSKEEAYYFVKKMAPMVFYHSDNGNDLAVEEVHVLSIDGVAFDFESSH